MKATICAAGGRVHIEPVAGGDAVRLEVTTDGGTTAAVLIDLSAGGAVLFALENALEVVDVSTVRRMVAKPEQLAVVECKNCAMRGCWARDDKPGVCLDFVAKPGPGRPIPIKEWNRMTDAERMAVRSIAP